MASEGILLPASTAICNVLTVEWKTLRFETSWRNMPDNELKMSHDDWHFHAWKACPVFPYDAMTRSSLEQTPFIFVSPVSYYLFSRPYQLPKFLTRDDKVFKWPTRESSTCLNILLDSVSVKISCRKLDPFNLKLHHLVEKEDSYLILKYFPSKDFNL